MNEEEELEHFRAGLDHSPLPWKAKPPGFLSDKANSRRIYDAEGRFVAEVGYVRDELYSNKRPEGMVNLRLILHSPDMLRFLDAISERAGCLDGTDGEAVNHFLDELVYGCGRFAETIRIGYDQGDVDGSSSLGFLNEDQWKTADTEEK